MKKFINYDTQEKIESVRDALIGAAALLYGVSMITEKFVDYGEYVQPTIETTVETEKEIVE